MTVKPLISLSVTALERPISARSESFHATSMQQHSGQFGVIGVNSGQSKSPQTKGKPRFCRAVDEGIVCLITRRSQVQILPPPLFPLVRGLHFGVGLFRVPFSV